MVGIQNRTIKALLNILIFFLVLVVMHYTIGRGILKQLEKEKANAAAAHAALAANSDLIKANPNPKKSMEEIQQAAEQLKAKAVSENELPKIIQQLTKKTSELGIDIISIKPTKNINFKDESLPQGVSKAYIEVVLKSSYYTIGDYLKVLRELPIIFTVESLSLEKAKDMLDETEGNKKKKEYDGGKVIANLLISSYTIWKL